MRSQEWSILMRALFQLAGRHGAAVVITGVILGLLCPALCDLARPYLSLAIFIFTFGSFLKLETSSLGNEISHLTRNVLMILWATFGVPLVIAFGIFLFRPSPQLAQGLLFWALVPTSPACVAFASILRLNPAVALLATVFGTVATPFYLPALATALGGTAVTIDPYAASFELFVIVGGAFVLALLVRRLFSSFVAANPEAIIGLSVSAMFLAGIGSMKGMQAHFLADPSTSLWFVALAYALLFGFEMLGTLMFWRYGTPIALTAGLISGTRTITLAWVVLGTKVAPMADLFLATSMVAKYTAPGLTKWLFNSLCKTRVAEPRAPDRLITQSTK
jgi:bile acid:Na+ symporter, BASS family